MFPTFPNLYIFAFLDRVTNLYKDVSSRLETRRALLLVQPLVEGAKADVLEDQLEPLLLTGRAVGHQQQDVGVGDPAQAGQLLLQQPRQGNPDLLAHRHPCQVPQLGCHRGGGGHEEGGEVPHRAQLRVGDGRHPRTA